jgi:F-type H+-transporting ATPase subunit epsilon
MEYLALDRGVLVKCGPDVLVSTRNAVRGSDLATLQEAVSREFRALREKEQTMRVLEAKLEADLVRRLVQVEKYA